MFRRLIKMTHGKKNNKGFSLVEMLVAIILLAIIVTPMFDSFITSAKINRNARKLMVATDLAQNIIEGMSEKTYETLYNAAKASETADLKDTSAFTTINDGAYNLGSNWVSLSSDPSVLNAFTIITPQEVQFTLDSTVYTAYTKDIISENSVTESMNMIFQKAIAPAMSGQKVYYCLLNSTDSAYASEGIIYLVYTNIVDPNRDLHGNAPTEDDYAYNAIVSIIPTAPGIEANEYYFSYNIKVTLYSTDNFDATASAPFGDPVITVLGGIASK